MTDQSDSDRDVRPARAPVTRAAMAEIAAPGVGYFTWILWVGWLVILGAILLALLLRDCCR
jgi:hypothetical protein